MRANHLVIVQNALERARCVSQKRYVEEPLTPWRDIETLVTFHTFPAAKAKREILLVAAEKTHSKAASGEYRVMRFGTGINTDRRAGRLHADRSHRTERQTTPPDSRSRRYDGDATRQILYGLPELCRLN